MANTYTQVYLQIVFAVQDRASLIQTQWKDELYKYITGIVHNNKHKLIAIGGVSDHLHVFVGYKPHQLIPELVQDIKGSSSKWLNKEKITKGRFKWQEGYGAFSYSNSHIDYVVKYIQNQEKHHKKRTFQEEYIEFLEKFHVSYDKRFVLKDV